MSQTQLTEQSWAGSVAISAGIGVFLGVSGENKPHKHWAHQIAIGLDGPIEVLSGDSQYVKRGLWIPAGIAHQLKAARVLCLYIDPTHEVCQTLSPPMVPHEGAVVALGEEVSSAYVTRFTQVGDLQAALLRFNQPCRCHPDSASDGRLKVIMAALENDLANGGDTSFKALSDLVYLSPSRFSHWFTEQTGLPLRSYRKWLRLLVGFELSRRMPLAAAAVGAGFSDQAHFCRSVIQAFGVSSTTIRRLLAHE